MDWLKEVFEAHNQRIKSPIIGSIILAFIAWNWQAVFYVLFASNSVRKRLLYWDANVLLWQDYLIPVFVGITFALLIPMITLIGAYASSWPTNQLRLLIDRQANKVDLEKAEHQQNLAKKNAIHKEELNEHRERFLESRVRQDDALSRIDDDSVREETKDELDEINLTEIETTVDEKLPDWMAPKPVALLNEETWKIESRWHYSELFEGAIEEDDDWFLEKIQTLRRLEGKVDPYEINNDVDRLLSQLAAISQRLSEVNKNQNLVVVFKRGVLEIIQKLREIYIELSARVYVDGEVVIDNFYLNDDIPF